MQRRPHLFTALVLAGAALGLFFATFSTADFARHLDRQVHAMNCSYIPGLSPVDPRSDCRVTMMSHYSSVMRDVVWGGIPISLPAMSVFAFLILFAVELCLTRRQEDPRATAFLALASLLPAATSVIMAIIALGKLDAACKLCIGIYVASGLTLVGALCLWRRAEQLRREDEIDRLSGRDRGEPVAARSDPFAPDPHERRLRAQVVTRPAAPVGPGYLAGAFAIGVALVAVPAAAYVALAPDHAVFIGACGELAEDKDAYSVMVPIDRHEGGVPTIEVLDPLCPTCRAFERRLDASGLRGELDRSAMLFPLDKECNWMLDESLHPGACAISEAILCAGERAGAVVEWAFSAQEEITAAAKASGEGARAMARGRFPELATCIGSSAVKSKLNKSLRWTVRNELQVLTPQLYVDGVKLCDEDMDLGMEFALSRMVERARAGTLSKRGAR